MKSIRNFLNNRNTIYNKAIIIFISVSFLSFGLTGTLLYRFMSDYSENESIDQMNQALDLIQSTLDTHVYTMHSEGVEEKIIDSNLFQRIANSYNSFTNSRIYIVDLAGRIVVASPPIGSDECTIKSDLIRKYNDSYYFVEELYAHVLKYSGKFIDKDDYFGLYSGTDMNWVTIASPLETFIDGESPILSGVIIISRPMTNVMQSTRTVINYFFISMCGSLLLSILISIFFTKKITEPIANMRVSANKVSKGDFRHTIEYKSKDDMGDLITSFNAMMKSLENQENTKNDFIANVSHELRTPMTIIGGFIDGMLDGTIPEDRRDHYLRIVWDEVYRMNNLVNEQLQIARFKQEEAHLKCKSFDINEMIRREIIKNEKSIEDKNIGIVVDFEVEKQNVYAEEESINRVIINLLNNAIKFTSENGIITLGTKLKKNTVEIYIKDTGIGIEPENLERIFERYFKSDKSRGLDKNGIGLGLSICKNILNAHKHNILAKNNKDGPGTTFVFWLDGDK